MASRGQLDERPAVGGDAAGPGTHPPRRPLVHARGSGNPDVRGLGFRYDQDERWPVPNPTGRAGVFEAYCPPHHPDMARAVEAFAEREFGPGGPFNPATPGAWTDSPGVRGSAQIHDEAFKACVAAQAQYVFGTFGKFPRTVPAVFIMNYLQAHQPASSSRSIVSNSRSVSLAEMDSPRAHLLPTSRSSPLTHTHSLPATQRAAPRQHQEDKPNT